MTSGPDGRAGAVGRAPASRAGDGAGGLGAATAGGAPGVEGGGGSRLLHAATAASTMTQSAAVRTTLTSHAAKRGR